MQCSTCGAESAAGKRFCGDCGAPISLSCAACGAAIEAGKRFCGDCGSPVADGTADPTRLADTPAGGGAPVSERRLCTVLFCDLVGFTPLSEARDPEEVRELLSQYFDAARTVIGRYGGTVEKFIGDAVMAVWGTPTAVEGDAERSVRAALDLVDTVRSLGREVGAADLAARAGVVTGEVAVTLGAVGQGMVAGDSVNTAARVQAAADPGAVLVDENTWRLVRGAIACTSLGDHELKGKAEPVPLWQADRVISAVGGNQRIDGLEAPLVGRDAELRLVKELFHACADRRTARLVSVVGPAGIGKSRLGWEFEKYVDGLADTVWWHRGRCLSYGDGVAFYALAEMVRQRLGIAEEESSATASEKLETKLASLIPDQTTRDYVRPRLARLLGVETAEGGALGREELYAGWRTFFEQLAANQPVVLLIEDLQYADSGLLDFVEHLLDWSRDVPIFVLTLARPDIEDRRPGWGTGRRNATSMTLEALDAESMSDMLDGLVAAMPAPARRLIAAHAQGIPLYAVETIRMLIDRDVVQPIDGVYRLVGDIGELSVPETLQSLLAARLDSLHADVRRLVSDAAVLGSTFPAEALKAVSGLATEDLQRMLGELVRREVLTVRADPLSPERGQYAFVQTMFRQVAYETLSRRERKARHLRVADHLASAFGDAGEEVSEVIAQHLLDALHAVPEDPDAPVIRQRAVDTLCRAAERASRTGAPGVAFRAYRRAVDLLLDAEPDEAQQRSAAGLLEAAVSAGGEAGDWPDAEICGGRAAALYERLGLPRDAARAAAEQANMIRRQSRLDEARVVLARSLAVLQDEPDADTVTALELFSALESFAGDGEASEPLIDQAFRLAQALGLDRTRFANLFITEGLTYSLTDRPVQAIAAYREAARLAREANQDVTAGRALLNLSDALLSHGEAAESAAAAAQAVTLMRRAGVGDAFFALGNQLQAMILTGDWKDAVALFEEADSTGVTDPYLHWSACLLLALRGDETAARRSLELVRPMATSQDPQDRSIAAISGCMTAWCSGDLHTALDTARTALVDAQMLGYSSESVRWCWPIAATVTLQRGEVDETRRLLESLEDVPPGRLHPIVRADRLRVRAGLLAAQQDPQAAAAHVEAVVALRELGSPWHLAVGLADQADHCAATGDTTTADILAAEAVEIAQRLDARPLLQRLQADRQPSSVGA